MICGGLAASGESELAALRIRRRRGRMGVRIRSRGEPLFYFCQIKGKVNCRNYNSLSYWRSHELYTVLANVFHL